MEKLEFKGKILIDEHEYFNLLKYKKLYLQFINIEEKEELKNKGGDEFER